MLDIGWTEIAVIVVIAIVVIGPKDLPKAMRTVAQMIGKVKAMMREFQNNIDDMIKETELEEVKNQISAVRNMNLENKISETIDKEGDLTKSMDFSKEAADFDKSMKDASSDDKKPAAVIDASSKDDPSDKKS